MLQEATQAQTPGGQDHRQRKKYKITEQCKVDQKALGSQILQKSKLLLSSGATSALCLSHKWGLYPHKLVFQIYYEGPN